MNGSTGIDTLCSGTRADSIRTGDGNDPVCTHAGVDRISGGAGLGDCIGHDTGRDKDFLQISGSGAGGTVTLWGHAGNDRLTSDCDDAVPDGAEICGLYPMHHVAAAGV